MLSGARSATPGCDYVMGLARFRRAALARFYFDNLRLRLGYFRIAGSDWKAVSHHRSAGRAGNEFLSPLNNRECKMMAGCGRPSQFHLNSSPGLSDL
jgi:hypothetical protein